MSYRIKLFASLKDAAGNDEWVCEVPSGTAKTLRDAFFEAFPSVDPLRSVTRVAVNHQFCPLDQAISPKDEIALIPPVSGG